MLSDALRSSARVHPHQQYQSDVEGGFPRAEGRGGGGMEVAWDGMEIRI